MRPALRLLREVAGWALVTSIVILPAAFISGLQFPVLIGLLGEGEQGIGRQMGITFSWNTIGAICGSLAGGFGLLPLLTAPGVWRSVAALLASLAFRSPPSPGDPKEDVDGRS